MQNPSYEEAIWIIYEKRKEAETYLNLIALAFTPKKYRSGFKLNQRRDVNKKDQIVYFLNMTFVIELMLKVLTKAWSNNKRLNHNVGDLYEEYFKKKHNDSELMKIIQTAIKDQKYLYELSKGLNEKLPGIENLYNELNEELIKKYPHRFINTDIDIPTSTTNYIKDNLKKCLAISYSSSPSPDKVQEFIDKTNIKIDKALSSTRKRMEKYKYPKRRQMQFSKN